jgi:hypothetical protein
LTDLVDMYGQFKRYAWRLEARNHYDVDGESAAELADFLLTGVPDRRTPEDDEWLAGIVDATRRGAQFGRVRLVGRPITDYTKYEFACYPDNVAAGEDVQIVERAWLPSHLQDALDFWLFDDTHVYIQRYDDDGHYLGAEYDPDVHRYLAIRQEVTTLSVSLAAYLARHGRDFEVVGNAATRRSS